VSELGRARVEKIVDNLREEKRKGPWRRGKNALFMSHRSKGDAATFLRVKLG
jgi:hypothetical protein